MLVMKLTLEVCMLPAVRTSIAEDSFVSEMRRHIGPFLAVLKYK